MGNNMDFSQIPNYNAYNEQLHGNMRDLNSHLQGMNQAGSNFGANMGAWGHSMGNWANNVANSANQMRQAQNQRPRAESNDRMFRRTGRPPEQSRQQNGRYNFNYGNGVNINTNEPPIDPFQRRHRGNSNSRRNRERYQPDQQSRAQQPAFQSGSNTNNFPRNEAKPNSRETNQNNNFEKLLKLAETYRNLKQFDKAAETYFQASVNS